MRVREVPSFPSMPTDYDAYDPTVPAPIIPPAAVGGARFAAAPIIGAAAPAIPPAAVGGAPFAAAPVIGAAAPVIPPAAVGGAPFAAAPIIGAAIGADNRPYTEFLQDPDLYRDDDSEAEPEAEPVIAASGSNAATSATAANKQKPAKVKADNTKKVHPKKGKSTAKAALELSLDFKPTSYRKHSSDDK